MKPKTGGFPSVKERYRQEIISYYKRRLNNPALDVDDRCIGDSGYFRNENDIIRLVDAFFDGTGEGGYWAYYDIEEYSDKTLKILISKLKWYYSEDFTDDTGPMEENARVYLNEYSQKVIDQMMSLYRNQNHGLDDIQVLNYINRFDQLKSVIKQKFENPQTKATIENLIPRDLQAKNKYLDITQWKDFNDFKRIIDASSKKDEDVYAKAVEKLKKKHPNTNEQTIKYYVNRFKSKLKDLQEKVRNQEEIALEHIPQELLNGDKYLDIMNWGFNDLEHLIDSVFPREEVGGKKVTKVDLNSADVDADKVYDKAGVQIFKGDSQHKCVRYGRNQYYSWCISRTGSDNLYYNYRLGFDRSNKLMFYFVIDRNKSDEKNGGVFKDPYHIVVIHALSNGKFTRSKANNDGDRPAGGCNWEELGQYFEGTQGQELWKKIKGLKEYFQYQDPSEEEVKIQQYQNKKITLKQFQELSFIDKKYWLMANAAAEDYNKERIVTSEIVKTVDPEIKNMLINNGRKFSFDELKENKALLRRYAVYRFTRHPDEALPYRFIPYLVEPNKEDPEHLQREYFQRFALEYLTFEEIEKYFSHIIVQEYVDDLVKHLLWLPDAAEKYMSPAQKKIFEIYKLSYKNVEIEGEGIDNEDNVKAPERSIVIYPFSYSSYNELGPKKDSYLTLIKKLAVKPLSDKSELEAFWMGVPITFYLNGKLFFFTAKTDTKDPSDKQEYVIMDETGKILYSGFKFMISIFNGNDRLKPNQLGRYNGKGSVLQNNEFTKLVITRLDGTKQDLTPQDLFKIQEKIEWNSNSLLFKAGLIK